MIDVAARTLPPPGSVTLDGQRYDVAVIGGGINGTAVARELAERAYSVLLVEKGDFGAGSSSRSSRIMHCGLNYLASALESPSVSGKVRNLALARAMMNERAMLASSLAGRLAPRTFVIPIRSQDAVKPWRYDLAFAVLRSLGGYGVPLDYKRYSGASLRSHPLAPFFGPGLVGLASFTEWIFDWPERICVEYALDAASHGATVLNYTTLRRAVRCGGCWELELTDSLNPARTMVAGARAVLNLTGVWSDSVNRLRTIDPGARTLPERTVTPNKGCHVAVRLPEPFRDVGIISRNMIGHLFLCVPWRDFHILGPTETIVDGEVGIAEVTDTDVEFLIAEAKAVIPAAGVDRDDILFHWAGFRPAAFEAENPRGAWTRMIHGRPAARGDALWMSMSWGRLADHRMTAWDFASHMVRHLGPPSALLSPRPAAHEEPPLPGGLDRIICDEAPASVADIMFGRTGWGWSADLGKSRIAEVSRAMARHVRTKGADEFAAEYEIALRRSFQRR